jgi:hypothetical protein
MSRRHNAPYTDRVLEDGLTIDYEGHDKSKKQPGEDPNSVDQPRHSQTGKLTQNGLFAQSIDEFKAGRRDPEIVRVYEKLFDGVWSEKGFFRLVDYRYGESGGRGVFKFSLEETEVDIDHQKLTVNKLRERTRMIPSEVKRQVWARDKGQCVICGATDELHFDHDLPFSKGGTSITPENVRILCARHNLQKSANIE